MRRWIPYAYHVEMASSPGRVRERCLGWRLVDIQRMEQPGEDGSFNPYRGTRVNQQSVLSSLNFTPGYVSSLLSENVPNVLPGGRRGIADAQTCIDPHDPGVLWTDHDWAYERVLDFAAHLRFDGREQVYSRAHVVLAGLPFSPQSQRRPIAQIRDLLDGWRLGVAAAWPSGRQPELLMTVTLGDGGWWPENMVSPQTIQAADLVHYLAARLLQTPGWVDCSRHVGSVLDVLDCREQLLDLTVAAPSIQEMGEICRIYLASAISDPLDAAFRDFDMVSDKGRQFCETLLQSADDAASAPYPEEVIDPDDLDAIGVLLP